MTKTGKRRGFGSLGVVVGAVAIALGAACGGSEVAPPDARCTPVQSLACVGGVSLAGSGGAEAGQATSGSSDTVAGTGGTVLPGPEHELLWGEVDVNPLQPSVVHDVPLSIDSTGATEVSAALMAWLAALPAASALAPAMIRFAKGGTYWVDYTILLRNDGGTGGIEGAMWPDVPAFDRSYTRLELNGATLEQRTKVPYKKGTTVLDPRKRWGDPILVTGGAHDVELANGTLRGPNPSANYQPAFEEWTGLRLNADPLVASTENLWIHHLSIESVFGDFIYLSSKTAAGSELKDVLIEDCTMKGAGRQGLVLHGGTHLVIRRNELRNVERLLIDCEPTAVQGWHYVSISKNTGSAGDLGFFQLSGNTNTSAADHLELVDNTIDHGLLTVDLGNTSPGTRAGFRFVGNRNVGPGVFKKTSIWPAVVRTVSWDELDIRDNVQAVDPVTMPTAVRFDGVAPVSALVTGNCWANAPDDQCMK